MWKQKALLRWSMWLENRARDRALRNSSTQGLGRGGGEKSGGAGWWTAGVIVGWDCRRCSDETRKGQVVVPWGAQKRLQPDTTKVLGFLCHQLH